MDDAEIKYLQDELIELFGKFQKVVDDFAIYRITASRKQRLLGIRKEDAKASDYRFPIEWFDEVWRIERAAEFVNFAGHFEYYRRKFIGAADPELLDHYPDEPIAPLVPGSTYSGSFASEDWRDLDQDEEDSYHGSSALGYWCRASGFFHAKLHVIDLSDWSSRFRELLVLIASDLGIAECLLALPWFPDDVHPKFLTVCDIDESKRARILGVVDSAEVIDLLPIQYLDTSEISPLSHYANRFIGAKAVRKTVRTRDLTRKRIDNMFKNEKLAFQLCAEARATFHLESVISCTLLEPIFNVRWGDNAGVDRVYWVKAKLAAMQFKASGTELPNRKWLAKFLDCIYGLLSDGSIEEMGLGNSVILFDQGSLAENKTVEFLLYLTSMEAALTRSGDYSSEKIANRCSRVLSTDAVEQIAIQTEIIEVYKRRNAIVHGKDPEAFRNPFEKETMEGRAFLFPRLRERSRKTIISIALALAHLRSKSAIASSSALGELCMVRRGFVPLEVAHLVEFMNDNNDKEFWTHFHDAVNLYSAASGFAFTDAFPA